MFATMRSLCAVQRKWILVFVRKASVDRPICLVALGKDNQIQ